MKGGIIMKKIKLVLIAMAVSLLAVGPGYAQPEGEGRPDLGKIKENIYQELKVTPEQQAQLEKNRTIQREKFLQLRTTMKEKEKQLQQALKDPEVAQGNIDPLVKEIKSLQEQLIDLRVSGIFAVKEILLPEQFAKFNQLMEKRQENKQGRFQQRQNKRQGMKAY